MKQKGGTQGQLVKYKAGGHNFELMCNRGTPLKYRQGSITALDEVVDAYEIWKNFKQGDRASEAELMYV